MVLNGNLNVNFNSSAEPLQIGGCVNVKGNITFNVTAVEDGLEFPVLSLFVSISSRILILALR